MAAGQAVTDWQTVDPGDWQDVSVKPPAKIPGMEKLGGSAPPAGQPPKNVVKPIAGEAPLPGESGLESGARAGYLAKYGMSPPDDLGSGIPGAGAESLVPALITSPGSLATGAAGSYIGYHGARKLGAPEPVAVAAGVAGGLAGGLVPGKVTQLLREMPESAASSIPMGKAAQWLARRGMPPPPGTNQFAAPYRGLPESAPRVSPTITPPKGPAPEPTALQRGMSPSARIPAPSPGAPPPPEPTALQRGMAPEARIPAPAPPKVTAPEPEPSPLQRGMSPDARIPVPKPPKIKPTPSEPEGTPLPTSLASQLPKSAPRKISMPSPRPEPPVEEPAPNTITSPETAGPVTSTLDKSSLNRMVHHAASLKGFDHDMIHDIVRERFGKNSLTELNEGQLWELYSDLGNPTKPGMGPGLPLKSTGQPSTTSMEDVLRRSIEATAGRKSRAIALSGPVESSAQAMGRKIISAKPEE